MAHVRESKNRHAKLEGHCVGFDAELSHVNLPPNAVSDGGSGVIHMGLLNIIRRMALREKQSIREISLRTGLSRNMIAKYLNAGTIEPTFTITERPSKLDPFADKLAAWLKIDWKVAQAAPNVEAASRGPGVSRLYRFLWPGRRLRPCVDFHSYDPDRECWPLLMP